MNRANPRVDVSGCFSFIDLSPPRAMAADPVGSSFDRNRELTGASGAMVTRLGRRAGALTVGARVGEAIDGSSNGATGEKRGAGERAAGVGGKPLASQWAFSTPGVSTNGPRKIGWRYLGPCKTPFS